MKTAIVKKRKFPHIFISGIGWKRCRKCQELYPKRSKFSSMCLDCLYKSEQERIKKWKKQYQKKK